MTARAATVTVAFPQPGRAPTRPMTSPGRTPRVVRLLAFAHYLDAQIRAGVYDDLADAARKLGLTRARVTQIANLTLLAPAIQEAILAMPLVTAGRDPVTERSVRQIVAEQVWKRQIGILKARFCLRVRGLDDQESH